MGEYAGRTAVITGAGSGLGAAMADLFGEAGANLVLLDIDGPRAEAKAAELRGRGIEAMALPVDVADKASLARAAEAARARFGAVHVLCANVGVQQFGAADTLTDQDWQWVLSVNVMGVIHTVNAFLPLLRAGEGDRHVVITSSCSFFQLGARMGAYVASKFAVTGYGEVLRQELAAEGINVTLVFPGGMPTRHLESSRASRPPALGESRFDMADVQVMMASAEISADHVATPAHAVRNLLRDLASGEPYIITHGTYRAQVEARQQAVLRAFDRMAAN
ncbi:SDR family NAD(P)-dependent oxidoreductase [Novosphingobium bradum]|uniref:SDR family NAD(P)-dependent oxidoreductase n=1 Tax=Novosphingobium bradum TaxID=1737444 RepID=A0ABV7IIY0_9SPHN